MLSRTTTVCPASTSSPGATRSATTTAGAGARTTPPASRVTRWVTPSTSTRCEPVRLDRDDGPAPAADAEPALQRAEPVQLDVDVAAVELHAVPVAADARDGQPVDLPAQAELDGPVHLVRRARAAAAGRGQERGPLPRLLGVGDVDGDLDQRHPGVADRRDAASTVPARSSQAVSAVPATTSGRSSRSSRNDLVVVPPAQDDGGLAQRAAQPGQRLGAVAAPGDDLGDHRVVQRRDDVADAEAGVDPHAGAGRQRASARPDRAPGRSPARRPRR